MSKDIPAPHQPIFSGVRFTVVYLLQGEEREARRRADLVCLDQTVEAAEESIPPGPIRDELVGRVEALEGAVASGYRAAISYPQELLDSQVSQLLNVMYGTSSLKDGIRVEQLYVPDDILTCWHGPRFGLDGLRHLVGVPSRPLACTVLKPVGLDAKALADLAYRMAVGGVDLIKDDQGLVDQTFCRFTDRVSRCAEAVAEANAKTGRECLYFPNIPGPWTVLRERWAFARKRGAGGVLLCPGLTGYDVMQELAGITDAACPIMSHPTLLGSFVVDPKNGIAPPVLFGKLPRLAGADVSVYPTYGLDFVISQDDCRKIAEACRNPWGSLAPIFPTAAGRMEVARIPEMCDLYGRDVVFILGSRIQENLERLTSLCDQFVRALERGSN